MNKDNAKEYLPLIQALAEGKTIQYQPFGENVGANIYPKGVWTDIKGEINFPHEAHCYRIKPETIELELWYHSRGGNTCDVKSTDKEQDWLKAGYRKIKMREIL